MIARAQLRNQTETRWIALSNISVISLQPSHQSGMTNVELWVSLDMKIHLPAGGRDDSWRYSPSLLIALAKSWLLTFHITSQHIMHNYNAEKKYFSKDFRGRAKSNVHCITETKWNKLAKTATQILTTQPLRFLPNNERIRTNEHISESLQILSIISFACFVFGQDNSNPFAFSVHRWSSIASLYFFLLWSLSSLKSRVLVTHLPALFSCPLALGVRF